MMDRFNKYKQQFVFVLVAEVIAAFLTYAMIQENLMLVFAFAITVNNTLIGWALFTVLGQLETNHISIDNVLGPETKNAVLFGLVGVLIYDENHVISWQSDLFNELSLDFVGLRLSECFPNIEENFESEEIHTVLVGQQQYEVYNN